MNLSYKFKLKDLFYFISKFLKVLEMIAKHFAGKLLAARDTPMLEMKTQNIAI
jgi:hypothetical protein